MKKISSRITAIAACAAMLTTAAALPQFAQSLNLPLFSASEVQAAAVASLTDDTKSSAKTNQFTGYVSDYIDSGMKTLTFYVTAKEDVKMSYGFGIDINEAPWWLEFDASGKFIDTKKGTVDAKSPEVELKAGVSTPITIDFSSIASKLKYDKKGTQYAAHFEFRNYYSGGSPITVDSIAANDTSENPTTSPTEKPSDGSEENTTKEGETKGEAFPEDATPKDLTDDTKTIVKTVTCKNPKAPINIKNNTFIGVTSKYGSKDKPIKTLTFHIETENPLYSFTYGFGVGTTEEEVYWGELTEDGKTYAKDGAGVTVDPEGKKSFSITIPMPSNVSYDEGGNTWDPAHFEFRNYFSGGGKITVKKIGVNETASDSLQPVKPSSKGLGNDTSIVDSYETVKEEDGLLKIKTTLTRKITAPKWKTTDGKEVDMVLTPGYDEDKYLDEYGTVTWDPSKPINSCQFKASDFGIIPGVTVGNDVHIDSLALTLKTEKDVTAQRFMFGGGITVAQGSPADTETVKKEAGVSKRPNSGFWYNDIGQNVMEDWQKALDSYKQKDPEAAAKIITPGNGYNITDFDAEQEGKQGSSYFTASWVVPDKVKQYEDLANGSVSFQYWYGQKETDVESPTAEDLELGPVSVEAAYVTYTETREVPYTGTLKATVGKTLKTSGELKLDYDEKFKTQRNYDIYAVKVNMTTPKDSQLVFDYGSSWVKPDGVDETGANKYKNGFFYTKDILKESNPNAASDFAIPVSDGKAHDYMFIFPEEYAGFAVTRGDDGKIKDMKKTTHCIDPKGEFDFGDWYSALKDGATDEGITINSVELYYYDSLAVEQNQITLDVGEKKQIDCSDPNNATYDGYNKSIIEVSKTGEVTGLKPGKTTVVVQRGAYEKVEVTVVVNDVATTAPATTVTTTTTTTTTTTAPVTTTKRQIPTEELKPTLYADTNCDGVVNISDVILLNKYLAGSADISPVGKLNADCYDSASYPGKLDSRDSVVILKRLVVLYKQAELPIKGE